MGVGLAGNRASGCTAHRSARQQDAYRLRPFGKHPSLFRLKDRKPEGSGSNEFERHAVNAIAQPRRLGPVLEDVPLMALAAGAMDFSTRKNQFEVSRGFDHLRINRLPEAGPSRTAIKLVFGGK